MKKTFSFLSVLNFFGILISSYLLYMHFSPEASDFCVLGERWNCDIVNKSIYAEIAGIPVSALGLVAYLSFFAFTLRGTRKDQKKFLPYFFALLSVGLLFTLYLTGIETFVLKTYCLFCVSQQIILLIEWAITLRIYLKFRK